MTDLVKIPFDELQIRSLVQHQQWAVRQRGTGEGLRPVCCPRHEEPFRPSPSDDGLPFFRCPHLDCNEQLIAVARDLTDWSWNQGFDLHAGRRCHCSQLDDALWRCTRCGRGCAPCWAGTHLDDEGDVCEPCLAVHPTGFAPRFDVVYVTEDHHDELVARKRAAARAFLRRSNETPIGVISPDLDSGSSVYLVILADLEIGVAHQNARIECSRLGHRPGHLGTDDTEGPYRCLRCGRMLTDDDQVESETFTMSSIVPPPGTSGPGWMIRSGDEGIELVAGERILGRHLAPELVDWLVDEARLASRET